MTTGAIIREKRRQMSLTQKELAAGICTPSMISQIEAGRAKPSQQLLEKIATKLEVPVETLVLTAH